MNLILLSDPDFIADHRVRVGGRRHQHITEILKAKKGQQLTVGRTNGLIGQGTVVSQNAKSIELDVILDTKPPEALPLTLILALPRPPMLKRILFQAAMLGIKKIVILNFNRVEKSLWNSSALKPAEIEEQLVLGLEQAKDTVMPEVVLKKRFKPFGEDELSGLIKGKLALVAHPEKNRGQRPIFLKNRALSPIFLVIGPEGGILDFEIDLLRKAGCQTLDLGARILRTDSVLPLAVGRLF